MKKIIIAGSRSFQDYNLLKNTLDNLFRDPFIVISGCAAGADTLGERYATEKGYPIEKHPADWKNLNVPICKVRYNKYGAYNAMAGHNRNAEMLESVKNNPDGGCVVVFWDGQSKGTKDMIKITQEAKIIIHIIKKE